MAHYNIVLLTYLLTLNWAVLIEAGSSVQAGGLTVLF